MLVRRAVGITGGDWHVCAEGLASAQGVVAETRIGDMPVAAVADCADACARNQTCLFFTATPQGAVVVGWWPLSVSVTVDPTPSQCKPVHRQGRC